MARPKTTYRCTDCGYTTTKWVGRCPECGSWGTIEETVIAAASTTKGRGTALALPSTPAVPITAISSSITRSQPTGIGELDRVLGGGIVPGSVVLLAGEPGVGKSTLLLEVVRRWAQLDRKSLYITGEESASQVRLRAERTDAVHENVFLAAEADLGAVLGHAEAVSPSLMVVDSVQTLSAADVDGVHGGVTQVRAITTALTSLAKAANIAIVLVGHVTKEGAVAGPRSLEHLVDVVLNFEGDKHTSLRMIRGIKNRFGPADEVGCFEQRDDGIHEIVDPSGLFLHHRDTVVPGTAITVAMDGKRPMLAEVQALVSGGQGVPRRAVSGLDNSRVAMMLAVAETRGKTPLGNRDVYTSTVGGMRLTEPSADLAIVLAVLSAFRDQPLPGNTVVIGEVGLAGEVRRVNAVERRLDEAARLGFTTAIVPPLTGPRKPKGIHAIEVANLGEAINYWTE